MMMMHASAFWNHLQIIAFRLQIIVGLFKLSAFRLQIIVGLFKLIAFRLQIIVGLFKLIAWGLIRDGHFPRPAVFGRNLQCQPVRGVRKPEKKAIGHTLARFKRAGVGTNGILECKVL
jgi:hypothetical protein